MNPRIRKNIAAALAVLAPLGTALVAQPAAAQYAQHSYRVAQAPAAVAPVVDSFVMTGGRIEPGRVVHFRLIGTPRAEASVNVANVIRGVPLLEVRPGVYEGSYTVRRGDPVDRFDRTVAILRTADRHVAARVNMDWREDRFAADQRRDDRAPRIFDITPANGERVHDDGRRNTRLSARISDDASGVDLNSVRLRINGRDVTAATRIQADEIRFRDDLPRGRHTAELTVRDRAGNASRVEWTFVVV